MRPTLVPLGVLFAAVLAGLGCSGRSAPATPSVRLLDGRTFDTLPLPALDFEAPLDAGRIPQRIVSLIPSATEFLATVGLADRLVGRCRFCDWPPRIVDVPEVGDLTTRSPERIADLRPDLVLTFGSDVDLVASLRRDFGLRVATPATEDLDALDRGLIEMAEAAGVPERGRQLVGWLAADLERVRRRFADRPRLRVLVVLDRTGWWVPGAPAFLGRLLEVAGAESVSRHASRAWHSASYEDVLDWAPEVVLDLGIGSGDAASRAEAERFWRDQVTLPAVRAGRVYLLQSGLLTRPGPRASFVAERLGQVLHDER